MRKLTVFNSISLDGYFTDAKGDIGWAHKNDPEWTELVGENARTWQQQREKKRPNSASPMSRFVVRFRLPGERAPHGGAPETRSRP